MFAGSSKLGGGGRGGSSGRGGGPGAQRHPSSSFSHPPSALHRPPTASRLSLGGNPRNNRSGGSSNSKNATSGPGGVEESFSLVPGNSPPAFAMIIKLAPDLVDEIRTLEAQGDSARIKFDSMANNPNGNVIKVGNKEFRFVWSRESGDLIDIYEQRQSGEDGNGLLVESGSVWRKVNVQRVLDESTQNNVKMRSEEAERKHKSRKAIVLDPSNPSLKNPIKQLAAAEVNPRRMGFKQKKEPPLKKRKVEPAQVGGPTKSFKTGVTSAANPRGRLSSSPLPSTPERSGVPASPLGIGSSIKVHTSSEEITPNQFKGKQNAGSEKGILSGSGNAIKEAARSKGNFGAKPVDIENMLTYFLTENKTNGMTIKSLEKAIGDSVPGAAKKIEPILRKIAICQAPGRYFLKSGVDMESVKKPSFDSGSSPEENGRQILASMDNHEKRPTPEQAFLDNPAIASEEHPQSDSRMDGEANASEKIDILGLSSSPDLFAGGRKESDNNSDGRTASSSESSSDSDSSDSDSGSNKSKSSDSDSDASSSGKEASDEDVDIMSSDDRELPSDNKLQMSSSPDQWRSMLHNGTEEKQDGEGSDAVDIDIEGDGSDAVDIERELVGEEHKEIPCKEGEMLREDAASILSDPGILQDREAFIGNLFDDGNGFRHEQSDSSERTSKGKLKEVPEKKQQVGKSEYTKGQKSDSLTQAATNSGSWDAATFFESPRDRRLEDTYKTPGIEGMNVIEEVSTDLDPLQSRTEMTPGKAGLEFQPSEKTRQLTEGSKHNRKSSREKVSKSSHHELSIPKQKKAPKRPKDVSTGGRQAEILGNSKDAPKFSSMNLASPKDGNRSETKKHPDAGGRALQRELSDLELGELREPLLEETPPTEKPFDRKGFLKLTDARPSTSDSHNNQDLSKGRPVGKSTLDSGRPSEDTTKSVQFGQYRPPQNLMRADIADVGNHFQKSNDGNRSRLNEAGAKVGNSIEGYGENQKKVQGAANQPHDLKRGISNNSIKQSKALASNNTISDRAEVRRDDTVATKENDRGQMRRESSPEEGNSSFYKYEKDTPELKGPVREFTQYKEYVEEYRDKYESYCALNKLLESYRNQFHKFGKDLEFAKGRDMERYHTILAQLKESYHQCGAVRF
ncbi:unnamed protein product [Linum tenue]|uniref:OCEL domain-containing protein n=1 Tax=Linum tenue TaxID=586396 RepID=A0AAV0I379_9ROSI|nr:unnamed protein product [Linum tenue]